MKYDEPADAYIQNLLLVFLDYWALKVLKLHFQHEGYKK